MTPCKMAIRVPRTRTKQNLPPRIKVSYPKAMTVCIAAACRYEGDPIIVLCSDSRETWGYTSSDLAVKMDIVGNGWIAQWANRPDSASELIERLKEWFDGAETATVHTVISLVGKALTGFKSSPLYEKNCCQMIISGFVKDEPVIVLIEGDAKGDLKISRPESFAAIGGGSTIATVLLTCRNHNYTDRLENTTYFVYEAKRFSEKADSVGPITTLSWQSPSRPRMHVHGEPFTANIAMVSQAGFAALEDIYHASGLKQKVHIDPFPDGFTQVFKEEPKGPQSTTGDLKARTYKSR